MDKLNVAILGDGLLGSELVKQTNWDCYSRKKNNFNINKIDECLSNNDYNVIINCIANTETYSKNKNLHWEINLIFLKDLITYCNKKSIKLIHISSDYIYTNSIIEASEDDVPVHLDTWYGYTKLVGDAIVQLYCDNFLLCRCTQKPKPFPYEKAWIDQIGNFDYVDKIASIIIEMINKNLYGLYNVGTEIKTMYELASKTNTVGKSFAPNYVPKNVTMNINKLKKDLNDNDKLSIT